MMYMYRKNKVFEILTIDFNWEAPLPEGHHVPPAVDSTNVDKISPFELHLLT